MASEKNGKNMEIYTIPTSESSLQKKTKDKKTFWQIDKEMFRFKVHYALIYGALGICLPYMPIFAEKRVGISASALAAILTAQRFILFFAKPGIGYIADCLKKMKVILCSLMAISAIFLFGLLIVPKIDKTPHQKIAYRNLHHDFNNSEAYMVCEFPQHNTSKLATVSKFNSSKEDYPCFVALHHLVDFFNQCFEDQSSVRVRNDSEYIIELEQILNDISSSESFLCNVSCRLNNKSQRFECVDSKDSAGELNYTQSPISDFQRLEFWIYALVFTISQVSANNIFTLTDTACCESVQLTGTQLGRQCVCGAISYGLMCPFGGFLNDYTGDFLASWIVMAILMTLCWINMVKLEIINPTFSKNLLKDIGIVLSSKEFLAFMFCVTMNGVGIGIAWFYLVLFLTGIGASRFLCGMVMFVEYFLGGIPFMFFSGWVIKKIGHFNVVTLSLLAYTIRFIWCSQLHNPWLILPVEVLHGVSEGLLYPNIASYAKLSAKPGTEASTQALLFTAHEGIGIAIGCIVAGIGFDSIGGHKTFLYLSIYAGCATILSIFLHMLVKRQKRCNKMTSTST